MAIKLSSTTLFENNVKPLVSCLKILRHVKDPTGMKEISLFRRQNSWQLLASLPEFSTGYCQRALVDESGMIRTQMGSKCLGSLVRYHSVTVTVVRQLVICWYEVLSKISI
jgi:hypothetical protein